ncbi:MAG: serine hydrolase [Acidobacteriota bacterium]|nr:serine hydrolase [Acidobacteriota bacterium]
MAAGFLLSATPATAAYAAPAPGAATRAKAPQAKKKRPVVRQSAAQKRAAARRSAARSRAAARAREAAAARALQAAMTPQFRTDVSGNKVPDVRAEAAIVFNPTTGEVLWEENSRAPRSIASITKVMTAIVVMADEPDLKEWVTIDRSDVTNASVTYLRAGERIQMLDLLHLTLIASDNGAARALARSSEGGMIGFLGRMNEKASQLGLQSTRFADPSGLDANNISSAYDVSHMISFAANDATIGMVMRKSTHAFYTDRRAISIKSTNKLLGDAPITAAKTGFTNKAGFCLATLLQMPQTNQQVAVVVLGAKSSMGRFWETRHLFNWVMDKAGTLFKDE